MPVNANNNVSLVSSLPSSSCAQIISTLPTRQPVSAIAISALYVAYPIHCTQRSDGYGVQIVRRDANGDDQYSERSGWLLCGHTQPVSALAFSCAMDGKEEDVILVTCSSDCIRFWRMNEVDNNNFTRQQPTQTEEYKQQLDEFDYHDRHEPPSRVLPASYPASSAVFSPDGSKLALSLLSPCLSGEEDLQSQPQGYYCIVILDVETGKLEALIEAHTASVTGMAFVPPLVSQSLVSSLSVCLFVSCSSDRTCKLWSLSTNCLLWDSAIISAAPFTCLAVHPTSPRFSVGSADGMVRCFELRTDKQQHQMTTNASTPNTSNIQQQHANKHKSRCISTSSNTVIKTNTSATPQITCQALHVLNLSKATQELEIEEKNRLRRIQREQFDKERKKVIRSKPQVASVQQVHQSSLYEDDEDEESCKPEPSCCSIVTLHYLHNSRHQQDVSSSALDALFIVCPTSVSISNTHTYAITGHQRLYPLSAIEQEDVHSLTNFGTAAHAAIVNIFHTTTDAQQAAALGILATPFAAELAIIAIQPEGFDRAGPTATSPYPSSLPHSSCYPSLSLCNNCPVPAGSFLHKHSFSLTSSSSSSSLSTSSSARRTQQKSPLVDAPIMFHSRIKSSGYGNTQRKQQMGQPMTNTPIKKKISSKLPVQCSSTAATAAAATYPVGLVWTHAVLSDLTALLPTPLHNSPICALQYTMDGRRVLTASMDHTAAVVRLATGSAASPTSAAASSTATAKAITYLAGHHSTVRRANWSGDNTMILTTSDDCTARLWQTGKAEPTLIFHTQLNSGASNIHNTSFDQTITNAQFFHQDRFILLTHKNKLHVYRYQVESPDRMQSKGHKYANAQSMAKYQQVFCYTAAETQSLTALACMNRLDSHLIFVSTGSRCIDVVDACTGQCVVRMQDVHGRVVHGLALSSSESPMIGHTPDALLVSVSTDNAVKLWDLRAGACARRLSGHLNRSAPLHASVSPCARYVATGSEDNHAYIYDIRSGSWMEKLAGATDTVSDVQWHPRKAKLMTASYDGCIRPYNCV